MPSTFPTLFPLILMILEEEVISSLYTKRKAGLRDVQPLAPSCSASEWQDWELNPELSVSKASAHDLETFHTGEAEFGDDLEPKHQGASSALKEMLHAQGGRWGGPSLPM